MTLFLTEHWKECQCPSPDLIPFRLKKWKRLKEEILSAHRGGKQTNKQNTMLLNQNRVPQELNYYISLVTKAISFSKVRDSRTNLENSYLLQSCPGHDCGLD